MNKINWINGQAGGTPLSAENLNQMQDNIEDAIEEVRDELSPSTTYTTEEQKIGTWINGKPIYRKVIKQIVNNINGSVDINLGTTDVEVFINGRVLVDTNEYTSIVNSQSTSTYYIRNFVFRKTSSNNTVSVATNMSGISGTIYVILEYTKTTD